jgi:hypothetical protein
MKSNPNTNLKEFLSLVRDGITKVYPANIEPKDWRIEWR